MQTLIDTTPTASVYGIHASHETPVGELSTIDVSGLIDALRHDPDESTAVTPEHRWLLGVWPAAPVDMSAGVGRSLLLFQLKAFEATPSVIERERAGIARREPVADPPAFAAFKALGRWLGADDAAIADMVGVGRTTPYAWKRAGHEPRAGTAQRIYEYHATLDSLRRRLGPDGLRRWLHEGVPPRRDELLAGGLERLEADVHALLFRREPARRVDLAAAPEETAPVELTRGERPLRPSGRRPRRPAG
jgi:hypothetical protein